MGFSIVALKTRQTKAVWIASLAASATLLLLPLVFKLDGRVHADWQQFLGRFHPLVVHLPISLILLVPILEFAGRTRPALREAAVYILSLSVFSCLAAVTLGYLLAYGGGEAGAKVTHHMWGGISLTIGVMTCFLVRPWWACGRLPHVYPSLLACVFFLMTWATHQGGALTHGDKYLTEYLPQPLRQWAGIGSPQSKTLAVSTSFYTRHIDPILNANCVACHGDAKTKGGLRVNSYSLLMKGGSDGPVILPGQPENSILFERITLPSGHKKFMPSEGKPPLKPEEIAWIKAWILQGASPTITSLDGISIREETTEASLPQVGDYSAVMAQIAEQERAEGITLVPVSRHAGDGLILNTVNVATTFNNAQLAQLEKFAPYIVEVELGRTQVTDDCFDTLAKFAHLRSLHLEGTAVTGAGLTKLTQLSQLTYINLSGTRVTGAAVTPLASMKHLHHLYLYNTPAQPASRVQTTQTLPRRSL